MFCIDTYGYSLSFHNFWPYTNWDRCKKLGPPSSNFFCAPPIYSRSKFENSANTRIYQRAMLVSQATKYWWVLDLSHIYIRELLSTDHESPRSGSSLMPITTHYRGCAWIRQQDALLTAKGVVWPVAMGCCNLSQCHNDILYIDHKFGDEYFTVRLCGRWWQYDCTQGGGVWATKQVTTEPRRYCTVTSWSVHVLQFIRIYMIHDITWWHMTCTVILLWTSLSGWYEISSMVSMWLVWPICGW